MYADSMEGKNVEKLVGYADADMAGNTVDRKSNSGFLLKIIGEVIRWRSRKQTCVALLSIEAEYISLSEACQEAKQINEWFKFKLYEMELEMETFSNRSKHIDTR